MNYLKHGLLLLFTVVSFSTLAQEQLTGVVMEEHEDGHLHALPGANVYWLGTTIGVAADSNGTFSIDYKPEYTQLVVSYIGYQSDTIAIPNNDKVVVVLKNAQVLTEYEVTHHKKSTEISFMDPIKTEMIGSEELQKAACCNLSESFETNPSVDVAFTDAVTGAKQIEMLGLDGKYVQISQESMQGVRGLGTAHGLSFVPGPWIEGIQLNKGAGSVVNGYESITGQINVELQKPLEADRLFVNGYFNEGSRSELNIHSALKVSPRWSTATLLHGSYRPVQHDRNNDGFTDMPTGRQLNGIHRWQYVGNKGWMGQLGVNVMHDDKQAGQITESHEGSQHHQHTPSIDPYSVDIESKRYQVWGKVGYLFPEKKYQSVGFQAQATEHIQISRFGNTNYTGLHDALYTNLIFQSILGNTNHKYKAGASYILDAFEDTRDTLRYTRIEHVPGAFFEYTYSATPNFSVVAGIRGDYHNLYGPFATPRLHMRWALTENTVLRLSGGRGQRTANIFAENQRAFVTSRTMQILNPSNNYGFGLEPEIAWNYGGNITQDFTIDYRDGYVSFDFYRTDFENQVLADYDTDAQAVYFYNSPSGSFANSLQAEVSWEALKRLDVRMAYRWYDVQANYQGEQLQRPLVATHRAFTNLALSTKDKLKFDYTVQWQGPKRIPNTSTNPTEYQLNDYSPSFFLMNAQVGKELGKFWDLYIGCENLLDFRQPDPILAADDPHGQYFDSSLIWGPIFGRNIYGGIRFNIK